MLDRQNGSPDTGDILLGLAIIFGTPILWGHRRRILHLSVDTKLGLSYLRCSGSLHLGESSPKEHMVATRTTTTTRTATMAPQPIQAPFLGFDCVDGDGVFGVGQKV